MEKARFGTDVPERVFFWSTSMVSQEFADKVERGISPTVREGSDFYAAKQ